MQELLNQTGDLADSGFPSYTLPQPNGLEERVRILHAARLASKPGTEFHYTDPNYAVLARVGEVASGKPFPRVRAPSIVRTKAPAEDRWGVSYPAIGSPMSAARPALGGRRGKRLG